MLPRSLDGNPPVSEGKDTTSEDSETFWGDSTLPLVSEPKLKIKRERKGTNPTADVFRLLNIANMELTVSLHSGRETIIAVDLENVVLIVPDIQIVRDGFLKKYKVQIIRGLLLNANNKQPKVDVVLSDMAANTTGNYLHDSQSSLDICGFVFDFVTRNLRTAESKG